jgi:hypothetical protein
MHLSFSLSAHASVLLLSVADVVCQLYHTLD